MNKMMTIPYSNEYENCVLHNALNLLHPNNLHLLKFDEKIFIFKPSNMLKKSIFRKSQYIHRSEAIENIIKTCKEEEEIFIVLFKNADKAINLKTKYRETYPNCDFELDKFKEILKEV